jgi:FAD/FMN-containing dehydrogenase
MATATRATESEFDVGKGFRGELIRPADPAYDEARRVHNGLIDKRPALIARCRGVADVADAVTFGQARQLEVAVRSGGHNVAGRATVAACWSTCRR